MKESKAGEEVAAVSTEAGSGSVEDRLLEYRGALRDLAEAADQLKELSESREAVALEVELLVRERAGLVEESSKYRDDDDVSVATIARYGTKIELQERRGERLEEQIALANKELEEQRGRLSLGLATVQRSFYQWKLGAVQKALEAQLIPGAGVLAVERVALHHKSLMPVRELEIPPSSDAKALIEAAGKLLAAVSAESLFPIPPYAPPAPSVAASACGEQVGLPFGDRGIDVELELAKIRREDPSLPLAGLYVRLKERFPHIFSPPQEILNLNEPLPTRPIKLIGSTTVPAEMEKVFVSEDRIFESLNS